MSAVQKESLSVLQELVPNTIARKILQVSKEIDHVAKDGKNTQQNYKYQAWDDVLPAVRDACIKFGLTLVPSFGVSHESVDTGQTSSGGKPIKKLFVAGTITLFNADDPAEAPIVMSWAGESLANDDKGVQKAITSATKYAYLKLFMIPCAETVDPDAETPQKRMQTTKQAAPALSAEKVTAAVCGDWWKSIGGTKEGWEQLPKVDRVRLVLEARDAGCKTPDDVSKYLHDGEVPAEV